MSGVDVLAKRFKLALNRYIVYEKVNVKVSQYQVKKSNGLFEELLSKIFFLKYFVINYVLNFMFTYNAQ